MISRLLRATLCAVPVIAFCAACGGGSDDAVRDTGSTSDPSSSQSTSSTPEVAEPPSESTTSSPAEPALGPCSEIWVADAKLPSPYRGCELDGETVRPAVVQCEFGQPLVTYGGEFYAVPNGPVNQTPGPVKQDRDYRSALSSCTA